ncbi:adenylate/guanylate cyclase domain-containing protein [Thalassoglobus polymorphus]|uniref:Adenylate cyclase 2 n=1 Tax=Thalassoglobus polymorphus TaxID=2527994 RepID=A0A517QNV2_9PLAN|nr:adenylate/guanylate cyclase domain-containing protein [Thalassoglobus polymorphus]QDT33338.1 Adenylate cyclase 2 [Thalassoglobus polymorphus]
MWQLSVQGPEPRQRWKQRLENRRSYSVGREQQCDLPVIWEPQLSRKHFSLKVERETVTLSVSEGAQNPIFHQGEKIQPGIHVAPDKFVVGKTAFYLNKISPTSNSPDAPFQELTFSNQELQKVEFADADRRLEALARLPEVINESASKEESASKLISVILAGIRHSEAAAVVALDSNRQMDIHAWERRNETEGVFKPSARLLKDAIDGKRSVLHVWEKSNEAGQQYTMAAEFDWAFCVPIQVSEREPWGIYVAGRLDTPFLEGGHLRQNIQSDVRFAQLVGEVISSSQRMNRMEGQLSVLRRFLSPPILRALEDTGHNHELNIDLLKPRECDVTVLFCDLRGFSHRAEESADDLTGLLDRVNAALEVMSSEILDHGGVTGDFLGDAVLGFWGWPFSSEDAPLKACRAALSIRHEFTRIQQEDGHPLQDFQVGIGIAHGRAVAGQIGTSGRMAVTVFGPVVNLASRLEGMTKKLRVPIVMDEATTEIARERLSEGEGRVRKLARVLPYGLENILNVSELVPPAGEDSELSDEQIQVYENGVKQFMDGDWEEAYRLLHSMPSSDQAQDFLLAIITQNNRRAPPNWRGVIELSNK